MLLALDTATRFASFALHDGRAIRYEMSWEAGRQHTTQLMPRVVEALEELEVRPEALSAVAVALGPGSFTGLRVGMAIAKGLALARGIPIIGIPTLDILAAAQERRRAPLRQWSRPGGAVSVRRATAGIRDGNGGMAPSWPHGRTFSPILPLPSCSVAR
jgi:tRNA threonylcarbamoyladenosine biosynthesis protein TsaB